MTKFEKQGAERLLRRTVYHFFGQTDLISQVQSEIDGLECDWILLDCCRLFWEFGGEDSGNLGRMSQPYY